MRHPISVFGLLVILMASVATPAPAENVPGVTDDRILVGMITDLTGPLAAIGQESSAGARLYLQHINDQGGVHGRKIELLVEDDNYKPPRTISAFRKLVDRDRIFCFIGNMGTATTMATFRFLKRERIPLIGPLAYASAMSTPPKRYVFSTTPPYDIQPWIILKYILEGEKATACRLATLYQDDDAGHDGLKGLRQAAAHYGLPIVAEESYKRGAVDFSTQMLNMKREDPTHVILLSIYRETAAFLREARMADWRPRFIGWIPASDEKIVELAGEAAEGYLAVQIADLWGDGEAIKRYRKLLREFTPDHGPAAYHVAGFSAAQILVEGLVRAGRNLTREKLVEAMESFKGWDKSVGSPITYGPDLRGGKDTAAFLVRADIEQKRMVRATDWISADRPER